MKRHDSIHDTLPIEVLVDYLAGEMSEEEEDALEELLIKNPEDYRVLEGIELFTENENVEYDEMLSALKAKANDTQFLNPTPKEEEKHYFFINKTQKSSKAFKLLISVASVAACVIFLFTILAIEAEKNRELAEKNRELVERILAIEKTSIKALDTSWLALVTSHEASYNSLITDSTDVYQSILNQESPSILSEGGSQAQKAEDDASGMIHIELPNEDSLYFCTKKSYEVLDIFGGTMNLGGIIFPDAFMATNRFPSYSEIVIDDKPTQKLPHTLSSKDNQPLAAEKATDAQGSFKLIYSRPPKTDSLIGWGFGDEDVSLQKFASHTYTEDSNYEVSLQIHDANSCADTLTKAQYASLSYPVADFDKSTSQVCPGTCINFTDTSTSDTTLVSWVWDFGDEETSTLQNPDHCYAVSGIYNVSLTITNMLGCSDTVTKANFAEILEPPTAQLALSSLESCVPFALSFQDQLTDNSSSVVSWAMDLNSDGLVNVNYSWIDSAAFTSPDREVLKNWNLVSEVEYISSSPDSSFVISSGNGYILLLTKNLHNNDSIKRTSIEFSLDSIHRLDSIRKLDELLHIPEYRKAKDP
ncbi:MAG: PKD domain-containing protein [Bacteroidota bacterium]